LLAVSRQPFVLRFRFIQQDGPDNLPDPLPQVRTRPSDRGVWIDDVRFQCPHAGYRGVPQRNTYGYRSGTSFATSYVAGAAALYVSRFPRASVAQVKRALLRGVDRKRSLRGKVRTGGRLNVYRTLRIRP
jgi:subtilisin family serine protease